MAQTPPDDWQNIHFVHRCCDYEIRPAVWNPNYIDRGEAPPEIIAWKPTMHENYVEVKSRNCVCCRRRKVIEYGKAAPVGSTERRRSERSHTMLWDMKDGGYAENVPLGLRVDMFNTNMHFEWKKFPIHGEDLYHNALFIYFLLI